LTVLSAVMTGCAAQGAGEVYDAHGESAEAGFVDLALGNDSMDCDNWRACAAHASGLFQGRRVALDVTIQAPVGSVGIIGVRSCPRNTANYVAQQGLTPASQPRSCGGKT
jgi:hypothetical protein